MTHDLCKLKVPNLIEFFQTPVQTCHAPQFFYVDMHYLRSSMGKFDANGFIRESLPA